MTSDYSDPRDTVTHYSYVTHPTSGDVYAVGENAEGTIIQARGPVYYQDRATRSADSYYGPGTVYNTDDDLIDGDWLQAEFDA